MNVEKIKRAVRSEYGPLDFGGSRMDDGVLRLVVKTNPREVTESIIEADYYQTHVEHDEKFVVLVDPETAEILGTDDVR